MKVVIQRTDNTLTQRINTKRRKIGRCTLRRKLTIEQHKLHTLIQVFRNGKPSCYFCKKKVII